MATLLQCAFDAHVGSFQDKGYVYFNMFVVIEIELKIVKN